MLKCYVIRSPIGAKIAKLLVEKLIESVFYGELIK
jgi:hypothetical protein